MTPRHRGWPLLKRHSVLGAGLLPADLVSKTIHRCWPLKFFIKALSEEPSRVFCVFFLNSVLSPLPPSFGFFLLLASLPVRRNTHKHLTLPPPPHQEKCIIQQYPQNLGGLKGWLKFLKCQVVLFFSPPFSLFPST